MVIRRSHERGYADRGWLRSHHTFSFADYHDPRQMGFRSLRVINDDWIAPGMGFGAHPHQEMEIVTYVLEGELAHQDSLGSKSTIRPGRVQRMSAGTGIVHSEFNASRTEPVRLLQIWLLPGTPGVTPGYEERDFAPEALRDRLAVIAAPGGPDGALHIHQDARLLASRLAPGVTVRHEADAGRHLWLQVASGTVTVNGAALQQGDAASFSPSANLEITAQTESELLLFDLA